MYGRRFPACTAETSDTGFYAGHYVYGGDECAQRDRGGVHPQFYGNRPSGGSDHMGQYAVSGGKGALVQFLVDHPDPRLFSGCNAVLHYEYWRLRAQTDTPAIREKKSVKRQRGAVDSAEGQGYNKIPCLFGAGKYKFNLVISGCYRRKKTCLARYFHVTVRTNITTRRKQNDHDGACMQVVQSSKKKRRHDRGLQGAVPAEKVSQLIIFITVYTRATTILIAEHANPRNVAKRKPTFVYDVKLSIAASYKL